MSCSRGPLLAHGLVHREVGALSPLSQEDLVVAALQDIPGSIGRPPHCVVGLSIAIIISGDRYVSAFPHCWTMNLVGVPLGTMNQVPLEGRHTA